MARSKANQEESNTAQGKEVAERDASVLAMYEESGETGFEDTSSEDFAVPFIKLLQKMSPEVDPDDGDYVEGARAGQFIKTSTQELFDSVDVIPCYYHRAMVEWYPQEEGGGLVGQFEPGEEQGLQRDESGRYWREHGESYLADTRYFFCLHVMEDGDLDPVVISFASTQIKKARNWLTRMQSIKATGASGRRFTLPMFSNVWKLSSQAEENKKGSYRGYKVDLVGPINDANIAQQAKDAREMFKGTSGKVKPPEEPGAGAEPEAGNAGGGKKDGKDDDIPF